MLVELDVTSKAVFAGEIGETGDVALCFTAHGVGELGGIHVVREDKSQWYWVGDSFLLPDLFRFGGNVGERGGDGPVSLIQVVRFSQVAFKKLSRFLTVSKPVTMNSARREERWNMLIFKLVHDEDEVQVLQSMEVKS